jgi:non-ribosomal peptide synthetase component F
VTSALAWWRKRLGDARPLALPRDRNADSRSAISARTPFGVPLTGEIDELTKRLRVTPYGIALAALNVFLAETCATDDLVTFTTSALNRQRSSALDAVAGFFMNPLPVRVSAAGDPTFAELVVRGSDSLRDGLAHEAPSVLVFDTPSPADSPFGRVMLNFIDGSDERERGALDVTPLPIDLPRDRKSPLAWVVMSRPGRLFGTLSGGADWFEAHTITRWAARLVQLLETGVRNPTHRLSELRAARAL